MPTLAESGAAYYASMEDSVTNFRARMEQKINEFQVLLQTSGEKLGDVLADEKDQGFLIAHSATNRKADEIAALADDFRNSYDLVGSEVVWSRGARP